VPGEVRGVGEDVCVLRTSDGSIHAFERTCPHAGADLANGYERGGRLHCAWHNLSFDLETGKQPCASLRDLRVFSLRDAGGGLFEVVERD
jgi:nitrite reductase/ring-hydroxylating ferredoxin subunit